MSRQYSYILITMLSLGCGTEAERRSFVPANLMDVEPAPAKSDVEPDTDWRSTVTQRIADSAFAIEHDGNAFVAANSPQGFRVAFDAGGAELWASDRRAGAVKIGGVDLVRGDSSSALAAADLSLGACRADGAVDARGECLQRLEGQRGSVTELWENRPDGLEHSFIVRERPEGDSALSVRVSVENAEITVDASGDSATFVSESAGLRLSYAGLKAWDASGTELVAQMEPARGGLQLVVDDAGAQYPITIDPVFTSVNWIGQGPHANAQFGHTVANAGDVNGDGFDDVVVAAPGVGRGVFLYLGGPGPAGVSPTAAWTVTGIVAPGTWTVDGAGDVNGDGFDDVIVGDHHFTNGQEFEGRALVYHGSAAGLGSSPAWIREANLVGADFGSAVAGAGDVDNDGFDDVIIGAARGDNGQADEGRAFLYRGSASGLGTSSAWTAESNQSNSRFGSSVAAAGDVNGDGFDDVIVGAFQLDNGQTDEGRALLYHGTASGLGTSPAWTAEGNQQAAGFGKSVAGAGDVNGDGFDDVIIESGPGDPQVIVYHGSASGLAASAAWNSTSGGNGTGIGDVNDDGFADVAIYVASMTLGGGVFVYHGGASGLASGPSWTVAPLTPNSEVVRFGSSLSSGDFNGDGFSDLLVGAPGDPANQANSLTGRASTYHGGPTGLIFASRTQLLTSNQAGAQFGESVAGAGDVNGDGFDDVIIGSWLFDNGQTNEGRAFVYHGGANGPSSTAAWIVENNQADSRFGYSVAGAGDVNGDGFDDVIISAHLFDGGQTDEGRVYIYHGSASGLSGTAARTLELNQTGARFGNVVASAGDVNGDGFDDVVIGAFLFDNGHTDEGRVVVYHGSPTGIGSLAAWVMESNQTSANYGVSVSGAGDVNGDGFDDVIVGAYLFDAGQIDEGRAFAYHGSAIGLSTLAWTAESNQAGAGFGRSVAAAGDTMIGDGFGDVIVGAYAYDDTFTDEGRAYIYSGGTNGLSTSAAHHLNGGQLGAQYGVAVAGAGDVDADGFDDVLVSAYLHDNGHTDEGIVRLYRGGAFGVTASPVFSRESNQADALLGLSVDGAGDVNGDGYADLIFGAYQYDFPLSGSNEGQVYIVF